MLPQSTNVTQFLTKVITHYKAQGRSRVSSILLSRSEERNFTNFKNELEAIVDKEISDFLVRMNHFVSMKGANTVINLLQELISDEELLKLHGIIKGMVAASINEEEYSRQYQDYKRNLSDAKQKLIKKDVKGLFKGDLEGVVVWIVHDRYGVSHERISKIYGVSTKAIHHKYGFIANMTRDNIKHRYIWAGIDKVIKELNIIEGHEQQEEAAAAVKEAS